MDGRRTLVVSLGLMAGCLGCAHDAGMPVTASNPLPADVKLQPDPPPRNPKPATCVALGDFSMQAANDANRSQIEKGQLHEQARKVYQKALELDPKNLQALAALARYYAKMDDQ